MNRETIYAITEFSSSAGVNEASNGAQRVDTSSAEATVPEPAPAASSPEVDAAQAEKIPSLEHDTCPDSRAFGGDADTESTVD